MRLPTKSPAIRGLCASQAANLSEAERVAQGQKRPRFDQDLTRTFWPRPTPTRRGVKVAGNSKWLEVRGTFTLVRRAIVAYAATLATTELTFWEPRTKTLERTNLDAGLNGAAK